jgi:hypothetical protein
MKIGPDTANSVSNMLIHFSNVPIDSQHYVLPNAAGRGGGHAVRCPAWLLQRRESRPDCHVAGAHAEALAVQKLRERNHPALVNC